MPISGTFAAAAGVLTLTFDRDLAPGAIGNPQWTVWANSLRHHALVVTAGAPAPRDVTGTFAPNFVAPPGTAVDYTAVPPDLTSVTGIPVVPFADFPLTPLP